MTDAMTSNNLPALNALADRINAEHEACHASMQKGLEHALKAGTLLLEAKAGLPHGEWLPWLGKNCPDISERTAQRYMRLAENLDDLGAKSATVADLTMRAAEEALTTSRGVEGNDPPVAPRLSWSERIAESDLPQGNSSCCVSRT